jgi:hypothetical protein
MVSDLCNFHNRIIEGSTRLGSMYWETLRVDEDDAPCVYEILT